MADQPAASATGKSILVAATLEIRDYELKLILRLRSIKERSKVVLDVSNGMARGIDSITPALSEVFVPPHNS